MPRVKPVRVIALRIDPDWSISVLAERAGISMTSARRYWYGTQDGKRVGDPMYVVDLQVLQRVARALGVSAYELLEIEDMQTRLAA